MGIGSDGDRCITGPITRSAFTRSIAFWGISLLKYIHKQAQAAWPGLSMEQLLDELRQIQQFVLLYPSQGEKGPQRAAIVRSKQTFPQLQLAKTLGLDELGKTRI